MKQNIVDFVQAKRIAVMGVSRSGKKFGNSIYAEMKGRGYQMVMIHPEATEINGEPCYPSLAAVQGKIDGVLICVQPQRSAQALRDAVAAGIKKIWVQQGGESPELRAAAKELDVDPVIGKCILMYAEPVTSLHKFHRTFARIFGQL